MTKTIPIVYEDHDLLALDKPQGLPSASGAENNLCSILFEERSELSKVKGYKSGEGGLLNRLDNDTGGLVLLAKTDEGFTWYSQLMKSGMVKKTYLAVVDGIPEESGGIIRYPVAHHPKNRSKMVCSKEGIRYCRGRIHEPATEWKLIRSANGLSLIEAVITQGVRHQIRVHLAAMGYPIRGDQLYNPEKTPDIRYHQLFSVRADLSDINGKPLHIQSGMTQSILDSF